MNHGILGCFFLMFFFFCNYISYIYIYIHIYTYIFIGQTHNRDSWDHERHFRCQDKSGNINASELRHVLSSSELALTKRKHKVLGRFRKKCKWLPLRSIVHFSNLCPYKSSFDAKTSVGLPANAGCHRRSFAGGTGASDVTDGPSFLAVRSVDYCANRGTDWSTVDRYQKHVQILSPDPQAYCTSVSESTRSELWVYDLPVVFLSVVVVLFDPLI